MNINYNEETIYGIFLSRHGILFNFNEKYDLRKGSLNLGHAIILDEEREDGAQSIKFHYSGKDLNFGYKPMFDCTKKKLSSIEIY